jgi:hypothetical protein
MAGFREESDEKEFDVFVNPDFGGEDLESFADAFAGWAPEEEASRRFNQSDCRELLAHIDRDDACAEVFVTTRCSVHCCDIRRPFTTFPVALFCS